MKHSIQMGKGVVCLLLFALFTPSVGYATPSVEERFNKLIVEAVKARNQGNLEKAISALQEAYELQPMPELLNNMGRVLEDQGQYIKAHKMYKRVVDDGSVGLGLRGMSSGRMGALNNKITRGWVVVTTADENTEIWIDGQPYQNASGEVATGPDTSIFEIHPQAGETIYLRFQKVPIGVRTPISINTEKAERSDGTLNFATIPGPTEKLQIGAYQVQGSLAGLERIHLPPNTYEINIQTLGAEPLAISATVRAGEVLDLKDAYDKQMNLQQQQIVVTSSGPGIMPWVVSGVGVLFLGAGGYFAYSGSQDQASINNATNSENVVEGMSQKEGFATNDDANSKATLGNVFLGVGIAATLGGTLWWALTKNPTTESSTTVESTTENNTRINLIPGWGVSLEGRF